MPTREEMIAAIRAKQATPSREEMIKAIRERQAASPEPQQDLPAEAGLQGFGQGGTLGYLPEIQAGVASAVENAMAPVGGGTPTPYEDLKKYFQKRDIGLRESNPIATAAGNIAGAVTGASLIPGAGAARGATTLGKLGYASATGGTYGALANPEVENTEADPYANLKARLNNAILGSATGGAFEAGAAGVSRAGQALQKAGQRMSDRAVFKQIGANAGQIKKVLKKEELPKIEKFVQGEGLLSPGNTLDDVAERSKEILKTEGPAIGDVYSKAQADAEAVANSIGANTSDELRVSGPELAKRIESKVKSEVKNHPDRDKVIREIDQSLGPLRDMGENANIKDLHEFRQGLDSNVDWSKSAQERPAIQDAYLTARNVVSDKNKEVIGKIDKYLGTDQAALLNKLNDRYSAASTVHSISQQGVSREMSKALMGHGVIGGLAGLGVGLETFRQTHDPLKAVGYGVLAGTGASLARRYGTPVGYYGGKGARQIGSQVQRLAEPLANSPILTGAGGASPWVLMNQGR